MTNKCQDDCGRYEFSKTFSFTGLITAATIFLLAQLAVITAWTVSHQRRLKQRRLENATMSLRTAHIAGCTSDSKSTLFDRDFLAIR